MSDNLMGDFTYGKGHHTGETLDVNRIMEMIPHRYPFLLVDRLNNLVRGESAVGIKSVTYNEPHFIGHFPSKPIMPGVLIIEAMAQTAAIVVVDAMGEHYKGKLVYFMSIDQAKFRRPVVPGDTLEIYVRKIKSRGNVWKFSCQAHIAAGLATESVACAMIGE